MGPVHLAGCTLVRNREGVVEIASPQIGPKRSRVFVSIPNPEIRQLVADAALRAFTALGAFCRPMIHPMSPDDRAAVLIALEANERAGTQLRAVLDFDRNKGRARSHLRPAPNEGRRIRIWGLAVYGPTLGKAPRLAPLRRPLHRSFEGAEGEGAEGKADETLELATKLRQSH